MHSSSGIKYQFKLSPFPSEWAKMNSAFFFRYVYAGQHKNNINRIIFSETQTNDPAFRDVFKMTEQDIVKAPAIIKDFDPAVVYKEVQKNTMNGFDSHLKTICQLSNKACLHGIDNSVTAFAHRTYAIVRGFGLAGMSKNPKEAHERLKQATDNGDAQSTLILLRAYASGDAAFIGVDQKNEIALNALFKKISQAHDKKKNKPLTADYGALDMLVASQKLSTNQTLPKILNHRDAPTALQMCVSASEIGIAVQHNHFRDHMTRQGLKL